MACDNILAFAVVRMQRKKLLYDVYQPAFIPLKKDSVHKNTERNTKLFYVRSNHRLLLESDYNFDSFSASLFIAVV